MGDTSVEAAARPFEVKFNPGVDPKKGKWPGMRAGLVERADGMEITWDVVVPMRDGTKLYADVFKPDNLQEEKLPIILTWSPYGKHGLKTFAMFPNSGVPEGTVSHYAVWEGPDPLHWTKRGYAIVNADCRGSWASEGDCEILSPQQGQDGHDLVEWAAALSWSNGRVGICGVSYLAISQWRIAETNPPHLTCIMPWEGFSDTYRDYSHHGGIPESKFVKFMEWSCQYSLGRVEDWVYMQKHHYLFDEYQKSRAANLRQINVPAYIVADWGDQGLHTRGTLLAFENISSKEKWLDIHGRKKWQYFYQPSSLERQEAFFQKYLKDQPSQVDSYPRVRIEVRERANEGIVRAEQEWPIQRAKALLKYFCASSGKLVDDLPSEIKTVSYDSQTNESVQFTHTFNQRTEITGTMRVRLWVSTDRGSDMDIFVRIDKIDAKGQRVPFISMSMIDDGPIALGWIRASHRELDLEKSTVYRPFLQHQRELPLRPREVVPVDIEVWPSSTSFSDGEALKVEIGGKDLFVYDLPQCQLHEELRNEGRHFIYAGGPYESYIVLPLVE